MASTTLQAFTAQNNGCGSDTTAFPLPINGPQSEATEAAVAYVDGRLLQRKISNRESARRSRARKQRHLDDLRALAAQLRAGNRELVGRRHAAWARVAVVRLANAELRAEAAALSRRLAAARQVLVLNQLYAMAAGLGTFEQTITSLIM